MEGSKVPFSPARSLESSHAAERERDAPLLLLHQYPLLIRRRIADVLKEEHEKSGEDERFVDDFSERVVGVGAEVAIREEGNW